ncbi:nucleotidyltransferase domain-containing protein [Chlorobium sp. N1]|uniref:nucleotidyltransferase family protein n=1 Tax=Chlorobium sp. N1 TaxID=2491138 RepID=UPI001038E182|nr:nucleotidyltransferase domain-containing protein [Chlorobium sp. N1]TCD47980.1 nucleotidyltransferase [Chlorobium sp. N1]
MIQETVLKILSEHKAELKHRYHVTRLGIFGSQARNTSDAESDIDIVVDMDPNLLLQAELKQKLETLMQNRVDLVRYRKRMNPYLKARIDREALYV